MFVDYGTQLNNIGLQLQNIGNQIKNIGIQNPMMYNQQFDFIGKEIFIIGNQIINYGMQISNIMNNIQNMQMINQMEMMNQFNQMDMMNQMMPQLNNQNNISLKENRIFFQFNNGKKRSIIINNGATIGELLKRFVNENNLEYNKFLFIFNGSSLSINDKTKIKDSDIYFSSIILAYETGEVPG